MAMTAWSAKVVAKLDQLVREELYFGTSEYESAERRGLPQERHSKDRPMAQLPRDGAAFRICLRLGLQIRHVDRSSLQDTAPADRPAHSGCHVTYRRRHRAAVGHGRQIIAHKPEDGYVVSAAES
jgi:hypothetical protein